MKFRLKLIVTTIIIPLLLTGCWDQRVYEKIGFILQVGIEPSDDKRLLVSYTSPVTDPNKQEEVELISSNVGLIREFREDARMISAKSLEGGKIQQVIISKSLAEKGIRNILEIFEREPANPAIAYVVITEISPKTIMDFSQKLKDKPRPSFYLNQLIENNARSSMCPKTTIYDFTVVAFAPGIDPIVPMVALENQEGKGLKITGTALFSSDKFVGKISPKQTSLLLAIKGKMANTEYIFKSIGPPENDNSGKTGAAALLYKVKRKIDIKIEDNIPIVKISLKFKCDYDEHEYDRIDKKETQEKYEKLMAQEIKNEAMKLLKYTQQVGSDPIGIGDMVRAKYYPFWRQHKWEEVYKQIIFEVDASVDIIRYGIIK